MKKLEDKIVSEGRVLEGSILDVGSFLNQKIDTVFTLDMADDIVSEFSDCSVTRVLTIESSGIAIGFAVALRLGVPLVFAKKYRSANASGNKLTSKIHSYTHGNDYTASVSSDHISEDDCVLIVDDFLANGEALRGLVDIVRSSGAALAGCAVQIEKGFQHGGDRLREEGVRVYSLANIESMSPEDGVRFRP